MRQYLAVVFAWGWMIAVQQADWRFGKWLLTGARQGSKWGLQLAYQLEARHSQCATRQWCIEWWCGFHQHGGVEEEALGKVEELFAMATSMTTTASATKKGRQANSRGHIMSFWCDSKGHYGSKCPHCKPEAANLTTMGEDNKVEDEGTATETSLVQHGKGQNVPEEGVLLDNQSTINVFSNPWLLMP